MIETVFRSEDLPAADRFDYWRDLQSRTHAPMDLTSVHADDFHAHQRTLDFATVSVWPATFQSAVFRRTPKLIRQADPEAYHLSVILRGTASAAWDDRDASYSLYDMHTRDSSRPCTIWAGRPDEVMKSVGVEVPKSLLPLPRAGVEAVIGRPMSGKNGIGALLTGFLTRLTEKTDDYTPTDEPRLATILIDLVTALFAHTLEDERAVPAETRHRMLVLRIQSFIRKHLHDADLSRDTIAAAHHISTSYLHRLFQVDGVTVMAWIRGQRLEGARSDLGDPRLVALPIHQIATRWGFTHHAVFTRAFRAHYGLSPSDYRHQGTPTGSRDAAAFTA